MTNFDNLRYTEPMNVSLTPELEKLVNAKVESGRYNSASEVVREALRLHQPLPPAGGAAVPVGPARSRSVVGGDNRLRLHGHLVDGPVAKIDHLLGVADGETRGSTFVPGVGGGGGVIVLERGGQSSVGDVSRQTAIAHALKSAIPRVENIYFLALVF